MIRKTFNAASAPQPVGNYSQAVEVTSAGRLLFVSGQIPVTAQGALPAASTRRHALRARP